MPSPSQIIRQCIADVSSLRERQIAQVGLHQRVVAVKLWQAQRFRGSYAATLQDARQGPAARFFLEHIYGVADFRERDAQFARIAGALERLFPQQVVQTATGLAQVHALTEELDDLMAQAVDAEIGPEGLSCGQYLAAWRLVGRRDARIRQLAAVLSLGRELDRLTRLPGLRVALRMMRGPAQSAGMGALQHFLENGFDTFAGMRGAEGFLTHIERTETVLIERLFDEEPVACETQLAAILGQAR